MASSQDAVDLPHEKADVENAGSPRGQTPEKPGSMSLDLSDWMSTLDESKHSEPLNTIAIPGSHNSFSYFLDLQAEMGPDTPDAVRIMGQMFGNAAKQIISRWSRTQNKTFKEQLEMGIRYFDLRVASKQGSEDVFFVHGLYGSKVQTCMEEINEFLSEHSKEIVLLDFNHFFNISQDQHQSLMNMLLEIFGCKLCPFLNVTSTTLEMLWANGLQVIVFYNDCSVEDNLQFWPGKMIPAPWYDTPDQNNLMQKLSEGKNHALPRDTFHVTQGVLTPTATSIFQNLQGSLESETKKLAPKLLQWIKGVNSHWPQQPLNIYTADFVDIDFVKTVISLNCK